MRIEKVPVLIVGGGGAGLTASMLLARLGIDALLVNSLPSTSTLPKAHVLNQRAMEIMRDCGVADEIYAVGTPPRQMSRAAFYVGLAGHPDAGRRLFAHESWGAGGLDEEWALASPMMSSNLPQIRLEPILRDGAERLAPGRVRFHHEVTTIDNGDDMVSVVVIDRDSGEQYRVDADYVLACDGGRTLGPQVGITLEGPRDLARTASLYVSADLSQWARDDDVLLRWIFSPDVGKMVVMAPMGPTRWGADSEEWVIHVNYPIDDERAFDDAEVERDVREALGIGDHPMTVHLVTRWTIGGQVADKFRTGRVFACGDAAHRHPPTGGLGLTSAMHDVHNLCWKIACVVKGVAGEALLDSYHDERRPVDSRNVTRSLENSRAYARMGHMLGILDATATPGERWANVSRMWIDDPDDAAHRRRVLEVMAAQSQEFREHDVEYGYAHVSRAVVPDGTPRADSDEFRLFTPSTRPGHPLPHAWLEDWNGNRLSTLDLVAGGRFVLIAGEDGDEWCDVARAVAGEMGIDLMACTVGHARGDLRDPRLRWQRVRGISPGGALLVRPDRCVAWRSIDGVSDPAAAIRSGFAQILHRAP